MTAEHESIITWGRIKQRRNQMQIGLRKKDILVHWELGYKFEITPNGVWISKDGINMFLPKRLVNDLDVAIKSLE